MASALCPSCGQNLGASPTTMLYCPKCDALLPGSTAPLDTGARPLSGPRVAPPEAQRVRSFSVYRRDPAIAQNHDANQMVSPDEVQFDGTIFPDGTTVIRWCTARPATAVFASFDDLVAIHGHLNDDYGTEFVFHDGGPMPS